jgi:hypothetical protein
MSCKIFEICLEVVAIPEAIYRISDIIRVPTATPKLFDQISFTSQPASELIMGC